MQGVNNMLIFMHNFGGGRAGRGRWWVGPLITALPFLLSSGILALPFHFLSMLLGFGGSQTWVYDPSRQAWVRQGTPQQTSRAASGSSSADGGSAAAASPRSQFDVDDASLVTDSLVGLTAMLFTAALTVILLKLFFAIRTGERPRLRQLLFEGWGPDPAAAAAGAAGAGGVGQQRRRGVGTRAERIETVARIMQALPVEVYRSREELERMSVGELKRLLLKRGGGAPGPECLEKTELVTALQEAGNSTAATCTICLGDYEPGDVLRVLHCGHQYHLPCLDKWLLSSADYSRPPACPVCAVELLEAPDSGGGGGGRG